MMHEMYMIRLQRSKVETDVERFWYYETKDDAQKVADKLQGYKVTIERHWARLPLRELIKAGDTMRYPKAINNEFNNWRTKL